MTRREILETAIRQAIACGYELQGVSTGTVDDQIRYVLNHRSTWYSVIYDHEFAKALWGRNSGCPGGYHIGGGYCLDYVHGFEKHLQQMVIADDPIKYLGEHLPGAES